MSGGIGGPQPYGKGFMGDSPRGSMSEGAGGPGIRGLWLPHLDLNQKPFELHLVLVVGRHRLAFPLYLLGCRDFAGGVVAG